MDFDENFIIDNVSLDKHVCNLNFGSREAECV